MRQVRLIIQTWQCAPVADAKMEYVHCTEVVDVSDALYQKLLRGIVIGVEVIEPPESSYEQS